MSENLKNMTCCDSNSECNCRQKQTERSAELQQLLQNRLNRIIGQLGGIKKMIDDNRYCGDVLTQLAAVESALQSLGYSVLKNHLETCVSEKLKAGDDGIIDETVELIKRLK